MALMYVMIPLLLVDMNAFSICGRFKTYQFVKQQQTVISVNSLVTILKYLTNNNSNY